MSLVCRYCRFFSSLPSPNDNKSQYIKPASGVRKFIGSKLLRLYGRYEDVLKRFPRLYQVYRVFADGNFPFSVYLFLLM